MIFNHPILFGCVRLEDYLNKGWPKCVGYFGILKFFCSEAVLTSQEMAGSPKPNSWGVAGNPNHSLPLIQEDTPCIQICCP